jgi:hypothetical protein
METGTVTDTSYSVAGKFGTSRFALKNRRTSSSRRIGSGPASSTVPFTGSSTATSVRAAATSSDTMGCTRAGDNRTVCPSVADWAMPLTNSVFLMLDMYNLFAGLMQISSAPLRSALVHLGK